MSYILGNMWSQTWENVYSKVLPFEGFPSFDITEILKEVKMNRGWKIM